MAQSKGNLAETGIGRDERSALLGSAIKEDTAALSHNENDPTQQLLLALGHFQRILQSARKGTDDLWSDECMNQLILGVEMALMQSWNQLVDAFTDAGRILQTYETADRARDAIPFLEESYDLLCGIVGEMMGGGVRPKVLDRWQEHYAKAVEAVGEAGLSLVDDGETDDSTGVGDPVSTDESASPFEFPQLSSAAGVTGDAATELPTLDELPPLERMLPRISGEGVALEPEPAESALAVAAVPSPRLSSQGVEPSKVVVDIVDRICDELAELGDRNPEDRALALETIGGGVSALKREAEQGGYALSSTLCEAMQKGCGLMAESESRVDERFTEICFAFCGVFVEAMDGAESENVQEWRSECEALVDEWAAASSGAGPQPEAAPVAEADAEAQAGVDAAPKSVEEVAEKSERIEAVASAEISEPETPWKGDSVTSAPDAQAAQVESVKVPGLEDTKSQALFDEAQEALATGDAGSAKALALRAAAEIAAAEVASSERLLQQCEARLKIRMDSTVGARGAVKESEKMVKSGASRVAAGEKALGEAKERTASMAQALSEDQDNIEAIDAQIAELKAKRGEAMEGITEGESSLNEAKGNESSVGERLDGFRLAEVEARKRLEASRQKVKDLQRDTSDVEGRMEKARELLTQHKMSLEDIRQTIGPPTMNDITGDEQREDLLF